MKKICFLFWMSYILFSCSAEQSTQQSQPQIPTIETVAPSSITQTSAVSGGNVTSDGDSTIISRGLCWSTNTNPTINNNSTSESGTTGIFSSVMANLTANQEYFVRSYAVNNVGIAYGNEINFTTGIYQIPTVETIAVSSITQTSAISGGNVTSDGGSVITSRGICWSISHNPTITNSNTSENGTIGTFSSTMNNLISSQTYYVRSYAINSMGVGYGNEVSFTTTAPANPQGGRAICDGTQPTIVIPVTSPTGKIWMDRNLGASRTATSKNDYESYGCLYQWGRGNDGHASVNWTSSTSGTPVNGISTVVSNVDTPNHGLFIVSQYNPWSTNGPWASWRDPMNDNLWQGVNGINNPCPSGYRLPTHTEILNEFTTNNITNSNSAFNSPLKLVQTSSYRDAGSGQIVTGLENNSGYWTSSVSSSEQGRYTVYGKFDSVNNVAGTYYTYRGTGYLVRCIKN